MIATAVFSLSAEILWQADLSKQGAPNAPGGFKTIKSGLGDTAKVEKGALVLNFHKGIGKGMQIRQQLPYPERGELSFDAIMNVGSKSGYGAWSVRMIFCDQLFAWNGSNNMGFSFFTPPSKWTNIMKGVHNKKVNYRIRYDRTKGTMDFFVDGSLIPTKSFSGLKMPAPINGKVDFTIANYGYAGGNLTHKISNIKLETVQDHANITEPKVIWTEKFSKDGTLQDNGYTQTMNNKKDQFQVKDGVLTMICQNSPYKGSMFTKMVPGALRAELTFEASVGVGTGYNHLCFTMNIGGITLSWNRGNQLHLYHGKQNKWYVVSNKIKVGTWQKYKVCIDGVSNVTEYYVDDMVNPVYIDRQCNYTPAYNVRFLFRNYGLCSGSITNKIRNIELKAVPAKKKAVTNP